MKKILGFMMMLLTACLPATHAAIQNGYYKMTASVETLQEVEGVSFLSECYVKVELDAAYQLVNITSPSLPMLSTFEYGDDYCSWAVCNNVGYYPVGTQVDNLFIYDSEGNFAGSIKITDEEEGFAMDDFVYSIFADYNDTFVARYTNVHFEYLGDEKPEGYEEQEDPSPVVIRDGYYKMTADVENLQEVEGISFLAESYVKVEIDSEYQLVTITSPKLPLLSGFEYGDDDCTWAVCNNVGSYSVSPDVDNLYIYDSEGNYSGSVKITATETGFTMDDFVYSLYADYSDTFVARYSNVHFDYLGKDKPEGYDEEDNPGDQPGDDPGDEPGDDVPSVLPVGNYLAEAVVNGKEEEPQTFRFTVVDHDGQKVIGQFLTENDYYTLNVNYASIDMEGITWGGHYAWGIPAIAGEGWDFQIIILPDGTNKQSVIDNGDGTFTLGDFNVGNWNFFGASDEQDSYTHVVARLDDGTGEEDTTGISLRISQDTNDCPTYNLQGLPVKSPKKGQIVIVGGKKYVTM